MTTLQEFAHLWDGSEPGWVLVRMNSQVMTLAVRFATAGPTLKDIAALRSAVSAFGEMRPSEAFFNEQTNVCLIIEDDSVAKQVYEESLARGLPVRHTEA